MVLNQEIGPIHPHLSEKKPESAILALPASRVPTKHVMQASGEDEDDFIFSIQNDYLPCFIVDQLVSVPDS